MFFIYRTSGPAYRGPLYHAAPVMHAPAIAVAADAVIFDPPLNLWR